MPHDQAILFLAIYPIQMYTYVNKIICTIMARAAWFVITWNKNKTCLSAIKWIYNLWCIYMTMKMKCDHIYVKAD